MTMTSPHFTDAEDQHLLSGWRSRTVLWSVLLAALGYFGFALWSGWGPLASAVGKVGLVGVGVALGLSLVNYGIRFIRWQIYLRALGHPVPWWPSLKIYLAGFALTTTPGKAGEALRGVLLRRWGVPYPVSLAAFLSERLSDLLAVVLLTLVGLSTYPAAQPLSIIGAAAVFCALLVLSNERWLQRLRGALAGAGRIRGLLGRLVDVLLQARRCLAPRVFFTATALSLLAWAAEAWAFHLILRWLGFDVALAFSIFVYAVSVLAGALTFVPGGLGGAEGTMVALLMWSGAGASQSVAATVIIRLATLWFAVGIGCALLALHTQSRRDAPSDTYSGALVRLLNFVSDRFRTLAVLFWLVGLLQAVLVAMRDHSLEKFQTWVVTQYYMNYLEFGFVKRGLVGTVLYPVFHRIGANVDVAKLVILVLDGLLFIALVLALDRLTKVVLPEEGTLAKLVRTAIVISPLGVMQYSYDTGRFDHINFALIAIAMWLLLNRRNLSAGVVLSIGILVHEAVFVFAYPLLLAMALALGKGSGSLRERWPAVVAFAILPLVAAGAVAMFGNAEIDPALILPATVVEGADVWQRGILKPAAELSWSQFAFLMFYVVAPYAFLWHFYRVNGLRIDLVFLTALAPIALFLLGIDYPRWCQIVFVSVLVALFFHSSQGHSRLDLPRSWVARASLAAYLFPLGPIGTLAPFPYLESFARNALGL
jgi:uncharacterized protein (TIRG00374 family)